jgi:hypothetical protein
VPSPDCVPAPALQAASWRRGRARPKNRRSGAVRHQDGELLSQHTLVTPGTRSPVNEQPMWQRSTERFSAGALWGRSRRLSCGNALPDGFVATPGPVVTPPRWWQPVAPEHALDLKRERKLASLVAAAMRRPAGRATRLSAPLASLSTCRRCQCHRPGTPVSAAFAGVPLTQPNWWPQPCRVGRLLRLLDK